MKAFALTSVCLVFLASLGANASTGVIISETERPEAPYAECEVRKGSALPNDQDHNDGNGLTKTVFIKNPGLPKLHLEKKDKLTGEIMIAADKIIHLAVRDTASHIMAYPMHVTPDYAESASVGMQDIKSGDWMSLKCQIVK